MALSIFTTITDPDKRGDNFADAYACYESLADEVVVIDGKETWPKEFNWQIIGEHFQMGYEACTEEWVIHADLDFIFHENDYNAIRQACNDNTEASALSFWKYQFVRPDRYNIKSRLIIAVNKGVCGDRIRFNGAGDLCQPTIDGELITPDDVPEACIPFYNYDFMLKTEDQIKDDIGRMDRAYHRHFDRWLYSKDGTAKSAYAGWLEMVSGRGNKPSKEIPLSDHPEVMQETIKNLRPDQFGYNGFGMFPDNNYVMEDNKC